MKKEKQIIKEEFVQVGLRVNGRIKKAENFSIEDFVRRITNRNFDIKIEIEKPSLFIRIFRWNSYQKNLKKGIVKFKKQYNAMVMANLHYNISQEIKKDNFGKK